MPVKRRAAKRRISLEVELEAWHLVFLAGSDFFGDASDLTGLPDPLRVNLDERARVETLRRGAAEEAWHRLGARWLAENPTDDPKWAEREFGNPSNSTGAEGSDQ